MARKWTLGATGSALLATAFIVVACSSKSDDDDGNGTGATGGTTAMAGTGNTGTAGTGTGGTGTGGSATGGTGTGGTATGGMGTGGTGATTATGGMGNATGGVPATGGMGGAAAAGPFDCAMKAATCDTYSDFATSDAAWWGSGDFNGGFSVFGDGIMRDTADTTKIHITGTVAGYGRGFNFWFAYCSDLSAFTGVQFTISGTTTAADTMANMIDFQPQTNTDYPWQPRPEDKKGGCTATDATNPWGECIAPTKHLTLADTPTMVLWTDPDLANGMPTPFDATTSPKEIIGLQWQFPWDASATEYTVDVTLDDVSFIGGMGTSCGTMVGGGMGGMGGMTGTGGMTGETGGMTGETGGMTGETGGMGGANGGMGGETAGMGGETGGMTGAGAPGGGMTGAD